MTQHWWIGHDTREQAAYDVAAYSLIRHATCPIVVHPLRHRDLRKRQLFWREWRMDATGQWWDDSDGKPFSTEFAFTRFLTVAVAREMGLEGWAFFCDCDFLFMDDVAKLDSYLDPSYAVMCVKHHFRPTKQFKMDGQIQARYPRKNWSSLMAFNINHKANDRLTPECVSMAAGSWLHGLTWLLLPGLDLIGELPPEWNRLVGHFDASAKVSALHYTEGGPWFEEWEPAPYDQQWLEEEARMRRPSEQMMIKQMNAWGKIHAVVG